MNDYWNDPPEEFEPPECCNEPMDIDDDSVCICLICGKRIKPKPDVDPAAFEDVELPDDYFKENI